MEPLIMDNVLMASEKVMECKSGQTKTSTSDSGRSIAEMEKAFSKMEQAERLIEVSGNMTSR
jgi:hypothetical protein